MSKLATLPYEFFARNTVIVAQDLLGCYLHFNQYCGMITETEAYRNSDDPASHAYRGITKRSGVMFGPPGRSYVYLIYGIYHCLNFVTEEPAIGGAVLLRGLKLIDSGLNLDGPGKLCRHLHITRQHNDLDLTIADNFYLSPRRQSIITNDIIASKRIGIKTGVDKLWRFNLIL